MMDSYCSINTFVYFTYKEDVSDLVFKCKYFNYK